VLVSTHSTSLDSEQEKFIYPRGKNMPNNKDQQTSDSKSSMSGSSNREFENQGKNTSSGMGDQSGKKSGSTSTKGAGSKSGMEDDEMNTAGGRQGSFSDKNRGSESQWSPGSSGSSDQ
jgi:hypothetical protein